MNRLAVIYKCRTTEVEFFNGLSDYNQHMMTIYKILKGKFLVVGSVFVRINGFRIMICKEFKEIKRWRFLLVHTEMIRQLRYPEQLMYFSRAVQE